MGSFGISNYILLLLTGIVMYYAWHYFKKASNQKKIRLSVYIMLLGIVPLISFLIAYILIKTSYLDFYGYILVMLFTISVFISVWLCVSYNGEYKKVELSAYIIIGAISILLMLSLGLIEILPNEILGLLLNPITSKGNQYDIWSRPPYQLAHFITYIFSFPYIASFIVSKIILSYRKSNEQLTHDLKN